MKKINLCLLYVLFMLCFVTMAKAQTGVAINTTGASADASAMLDISSTSKGLLLPRVTTTQRNAIVLPATSLVIYNTTLNALQVNIGTPAVPIWSTLSTTAVTNDWSITGNSGTNSGTNFLGTTDNVSLRFRTNNTERVIIDSLGRVGIGSNSFDPANPGKLLVEYGSTTSNTIANFKGDVDGYMQLNIQNRNSGTGSSSDIVATADNGTDTSNFIDMGINSSNYNPGAENFGGPNDGYLYTYGSNMLFGAEAVNSDIIFLNGGGSVRRHSTLRIIGSTGNIVVGKGEGTNIATGNTIRAVNAGGTNIAGGTLTLQGGLATGTGMGGSVNITGGSSGSGSAGAVNINAGLNFATNINTGTSNQNVTVGGSSNNILLPKFTTVGGIIYTAVNTGQIGATSAGTSGYVLQSNGGSSAPSWINPSSLATSSSNAWALLGNSGLVDNTNNFLGTNDNVPINFRYGGQRAGRIDAANTFLGSYSGYNNTYSSTLNTGIGYHALFTNTTGTRNTAIGYGALQNNTGTDNIGVGYAAETNGTTNAIAIGSNSYITGSNGIAIGTSAQAFTNQYAMAIGSNTYANGVNSIAIGSGSGAASNKTQAQGTASLSLGFNAYSGAANNISIGSNTNTTSNTNAMAIGTGAASSAANTVSLGVSTNTTGTNSIAIGNAAVSSFTSATALGDGANGNALNGTAIGAKTTANGTNSTAVGYNASATTSNSIVLGDASNTSVNVGIGLTNPTYKLHVNATSNPLFLNGVVTGASTDSLLTIINGVVKKLNPNNLSVSSAWSVTGNPATVAGTNFIGTTDAIDFVTKTNNTERMRVTSAGDVIIGAGDNSGSATDGLIRGANETGGNRTGADITIQAGNGTGNGGSGSVIFKTAAAGLPGNTAATLTEKIRIDNAGNLGIGTTSPSEKIDVAGNVKFSGALMPNNLPGTSGYILKSNGAGTAPTWVDMSTLNWALDGNSVTAIKNLGTISNYDLPFITNNTEKMRLTSGGYLGVNITAPEVPLHVIKNTGSGATQDDVATIESRNTTIVLTSQPPILNLVRQVPAAYYLPGQNGVGGVVSFGHRVPGSATVNDVIQIQTGSMNGNAGIVFATRTGMTNGNPATGTLTGSLIFGGGTMSGNMVLSGNTLAVGNLLGGATGLTTDANGNIIRNPSDAKLKTNVTTISSALAKVKQLRGVTYNWIDTKRFGTEKEIGFIAQEIEKVIPEVVKSGGEYKSVNYNVITALLAEAMKEQQKQIEDQTAKAESLQKTLDAQQKMIELLVQQVKELKEKVK